MKRTVTFLFFWFGTFLGLYAQLSLQPGATWLFRSQIWGVQYGEKWEYQSSAGSLVNMRVTTKCFGAPPGFPLNCVPEQVRTRQFTVTADKVETSDGITVADFSLQLGDLTDSPYNFGSFPSEPGFCDSLRLIPAKVVESGTETVNGTGSRYYVIRYLAGLMGSGPDSVWMERKFSEYAWIVGGYWWNADSWIFAQQCGIVDPIVMRVLECYYDNSFAQPAVCDQNWFTEMNVEKTELSMPVSVYPNPGTDRLNVSLPEGDAGWRYRVLSADGKQLAAGSLPGGQVDIAGLASGLYFLLLENGSRTARSPFVKQ